MALTKNARELVATGTSNAVGATIYGRVDLNAAQGPSRLTVKIKNGATGPTVQCTARVLIAHKAVLPAAGAAGADWKTHYPPVGPGVAANAEGEWSYPIGREIMCLEVEFTGNTGQPVTVEAYLSELTAVA
ncbi:hypothetical protein [Nitrosovibrio sp. Nv6]|uniref:hypothetical protein n=1 Tax=Nitrosovibrio sp. Nv6 TaxID=1855340 RepID=UPI0008CCAA47|nr:hypothetical protein [Nitrosovibrio sp. Nv6]SEO63872.1 hypothetical protein SAMN05216316_0680 [Nitrosovibrio sp. Nv6]